MSISQVVVWASALSFLGWVFESTYCAVTNGEWERRGFLFGPICPIYGISATLALLLFDNAAVSSGAFPPWAVFLVCAAGSAVIEYVTSFALERAFGAVWWDYSNMPLNFNGRICLPASLLFGVMGLVVTYLVLPPVRAVNAAVPAVAFEALALLLVIVETVDATLTVSTLSDLLKRVQEYDASINEAMGRAYSTTSETISSAASTIRETPGRLRESGAEALGRAGETVSERQESLRAFVGSLPTGQRRILRHAQRLDFKRLMVTPSLLRRAVDEARRQDEKSARRGGDLFGRGR